MGISCQRNVYWVATNHLLGRGLVQPLLPQIRFYSRAIRRTRPSFSIVGCGFRISCYRGYLL